MSVSKTDGLKVRDKACTRVACARLCGSIAAVHPYACACAFNGFLICCKFLVVSSLSLPAHTAVFPVPILFLSLWLSKCGEESAEIGALLKELDCALGDRSDNEMVGGRKTHFLTHERERDILIWLLEIALTRKKKDNSKIQQCYLISAHEI